MAASNFETALKLVLVHEGGYVNHPRDPGGATNKGITQATYDAWRRARSMSTRSVKLITEAEIREIYRGGYWNMVKGDQLPAGLDYAVFDFAVNSGPRRAAQFLQRILGVNVDGIIGPVTLAAADKSDVRNVIGRLCDQRLAWLKTLSHWPTFGRGWTNRVAGVRRDAIAMAGGTTPVSTDEVRIYQQQLATLGYDPGPIDGIYGIRTREAVMRFQREYGGLIVDGIVGPHTKAALDRAIEKLTPVTPVEPPSITPETSTWKWVVGVLVALVLIILAFIGAR